MRKNDNDADDGNDYDLATLLDHFKAIYFLTKVNIYAALFHDAVLLYAHALNETLADGHSPSDGDVITSKMRNRTIDGLLASNCLSFNAFVELLLKVNVFVHWYSMGIYVLCLLSHASELVGKNCIKSR